MISSSHFSGFFRVMFVAGLLLGSARAAVFGISPVTMEINPLQQLNAMTTIRNQSDESTEFTAQLLRWSQKDGKDINEPTRDGLVNPPRFTIAPGHSQVVRIGLRVRPSSPEVTYRLLLTQVPAPPKASLPSSDKGEKSDKTTVSITPIYTFSLPLFVERPGGQAKLSRHLERDPEGNLTLVISNTGTRYQVYRNLTGTIGDQNFSLGGTYVLAGSTMRLALPKQKYSAATLSIKYNNAEQQEQNEVLDIPLP